MCPICILPNFNLWYIVKICIKIWVERGKRIYGLSFWFLIRNFWDGFYAFITESVEWWQEMRGQRNEAIICSKDTRVVFNQELCGSWSVPLDHLYALDFFPIYNNLQNPFSWKKEVLLDNSTFRMSIYGNWTLKKSSQFQCLVMKIGQWCQLRCISADCLFLFLSQEWQMCISKQWHIDYSLKYMFTWHCCLKLQLRGQEGQPDSHASISA